MYIITCMAPINLLQFLPSSDLTILTAGGRITRVPPSVSGISRILKGRYVFLGGFHRRMVGTEHSEICKAKRCHWSHLLCVSCLHFSLVLPGYVHVDDS